MAKCVYINGRRVQLIKSAFAFMEWHHIQEQNNDKMVVKERGKSLIVGIFNLPPGNVS